MISYEKEVEGDREEELEESTEGRELEVSLNAQSLMEINFPKTMKFVADLEGRQVVILLDSGVIHNFISNRVVAKLKLRVRHTNFAIILGDDRKIEEVGRCKKMELKFQGICIVQNFFLFCLEGIDIILRIDWLNRLGEVKLNWKEQIMGFEWQGERVEIRGDLSLS